MLASSRDFQGVSSEISENAKKVCIVITHSDPYVPKHSMLKMLMVHLKVMSFLILTTGKIK